MSTTILEANKTSLNYWFPRVCTLGIPVPRTIILPCDKGHLLGAMEGEHGLNPDFLGRLKEFASQLGYPLFLRTDLCSGKHGWKKTCYVPTSGELVSGLFGVCEENEMAGFIGLPYSAIVLREFLQLETSFKAFYGEMPINKERRYFIENGEVICHHPYWPEHSIEDHTEDADWREKLAALNAEPNDEIALLSHYAKKVSTELEGYWSADFAKATNGTWYLIDMAEGSKSFHWEGCPKSKLAGTDV